MKTSTMIWIIIIILIIAGVGWYLYASTEPAGAPTTSMQTQPPYPPGTGTGATTTPASGTPIPPGTGTAPATSGLPMTATVTLTNNGFNPAIVTIAKGGTVTFVNQSSGEMYIASDPHPTHQGYSGTTRAQHCPDTAGTAFDQCTPGNTYSFTFQKVGSWGYHDHESPNLRGTVVVQ